MISADQIRTWCEATTKINELQKELFREQTRLNAFLVGLDRKDVEELETMIQSAKEALYQDDREKAVEKEAADFKSMHHGAR